MRAPDGGVGTLVKSVVVGKVWQHNSTMALPRRGTRTLVVDGYVIRWLYTYRDHPDGSGVLIAQLASGDMGARLVVLLPWRLPEFWLSGHLKRWPLPTVWAAECFRAALRHRWAPDLRGPEVCRTLAELRLDLPLPPIAIVAERRRLIRRR